MSDSPLIFNAFDMSCVGHINHGLWTHPRDRSVEFGTIGYWTDLARILEQGLFDAIFLADILGANDVYGDGLDLTLREAVQLPLHDPVPIVAAMAAVTQHLGFGVTVNALTEHPYLLARRFATLDHLTDGRVGWNVVTGYLESAARAIGLERQIPHDERYERADEFLEVFYRLLESSWEDDAVRADRSQRIYAAPGSVQPIRYRGRYYQCEGVHLAAPSRQRTPVLFQAGTSSRGISFAARHAEGVFLLGQKPGPVRESVDALRRAVADAGRAPSDVRILLGATVVAGASEAEARDRFEEYRRYASPEAGLAHFAATTGIDISRLGPDDPIPVPQGESIRSDVERARGQNPTRRALLEQYALGGRYLTFVGDGGSIAEQMQQWRESTGIDGFQITRTVAPECFEHFARYVAPALQERGLHKTAYSEGSLRHKLFARGDRLPEGHPGARVRGSGILPRSTRLE